MSDISGPLGINPLHFSAGCFLLLFLFVTYLLLPRGVRVQYFGAYPKRYAWSARSRGRMNKQRSGMSNNGGSVVGGDGASIYGSSVAGGSAVLQSQQQQQQRPGSGMMGNNNNNNTPGGAASTISASAAASD